MNKQVKKIILRTKKQVFGDMLGNNSSLFHGEGFEFAELREYIYGDDVRKIDWKTTAKLGKPFVKVYREERELNVLVSTMLNGSTYFGTVRQKSDYISELVAILGFSAVRNSDLFTYMNYADKLYHHSKPSKKLFAVSTETEYAASFDPLGKKGDFTGWINTIYNRVKKKSLMFLISDFVGDVDLRLLAKKHDLFVLIVRDKFEENPTELGYIRLLDTENKSSYEGDINRTTVNSYQKALRQNDQKLYKQFKEYGIRYIKMFTDEDPIAKIMTRMR
ncbi:MAG: DUF58 domain-containing protein [Sulfurovum sp.]|nr:DUF58 domain-containing protein [Sulfurovum sp.]